MKSFDRDINTTQLLRLSIQKIDNFFFAFGLLILI